MLQVEDSNRPVLSNRAKALIFRKLNIVHSAIVSHELGHYGLTVDVPHSHSVVDRRGSNLMQVVRVPIERGQRARVLRVVFKFDKFL